MHHAPNYARRMTVHELVPLDDGSGGTFGGEIPGPNGDGSWLFAVPDGESATDSTIMLSMSSASDLFLGRLDLSSLDNGKRGGAVVGSFESATLNLLWAQVDLTDYGDSVTDHWHIYADGSHWLAFAVNNGDPLDTETDLWLLRIETADVLTAIDDAVASFSPTGTVLASGAVLVYTTKAAADVPSTYADYAKAGGVALVNETAGSHSTNDHFIVAVTGGIAVAIWNGTTKALRILTVDSATLTLTADTNFAGASPLVETNTTGSAQPGVLDHDRRRVLVPTVLMPTTTSNVINLLDTNESFEDSDTTVLGTIEDTAYNLQMASFVELPNTDLVIAYKRVPISGYYDASNTEPVIDDWGDIVVELYSGELLIPDVTYVCLEASSASGGTFGNRPHVARWRRWIITTWDTAQFGGALAINHSCYLRIDLLDGTV